MTLKNSRALFLFLRALTLSKLNKHSKIFFMFPEDLFGCGLSARKCLNRAMTTGWWFLELVELAKQVLFSDSSMALSGTLIFPLLKTLTERY